MGADPTPEELRRLSSESGDFTAIFWRVNPAGRVVRDAKFYPDAGTVEVAAGLFAADFAGVQTGLCAMLRGQVKTVDDLEEAGALVGPQWDKVLHEYSQRGVGVEGSPFTVYASWNTGDGPVRWVRQVHALNSEHAELFATADKTIGSFLVAGVVDGFVPDEQADAKWATPTGEPVVEAPRSWWQRLTGARR